ncbi:MAG TPA: hypothetical protein VGR60_03240 [Gemmatimonadales bacterium]|nr:hypothetical protein [Gemmatimonadales bacterium]
MSHDRALLRNLVTRVWALDNARIDDVEGTFDDWEAFRAAREKRARTAAAEARQAEAKKPRQKADPEEERRARQSAERTAGRKREAAEGRVQRLEGAVRELESRLADPALYQGKDGAGEAARLNAELTSRKAELDRAMEDWAALN